MEFLINTQYRIALPDEKFFENLIRQAEPPLAPMTDGANALYGPKDDWCSHLVLGRSCVDLVLYVTDNALRSMEELSDGIELDWWLITEDGKHYRTKQPVKFDGFSYSAGSTNPGARVCYSIKNYRRYFDM